MVIFVLEPASSDIWKWTVVNEINDLFSMCTDYLLILVIANVLPLHNKVFSFLNEHFHQSRLTEHHLLPALLRAENVYEHS